MLQGPNQSRANSKDAAASIGKGVVTLASVARCGYKERV